MKKRSLDELNRISVAEFREAEKFPVTVVLDNIRSMNNVGAFFRTGDAFRIQKMYLCGYTPCPPHREISKSALGAELSVEWEHAADTVSVVRALKASGWQVLAVEQAEDSSMLEDADFDLSMPIAVVFGNEVNGVDEEVMQLVDGCVEIRQFGTKHSLNVAVSGGIVLWKLANCYLTKR